MKRLTTLLLTGITVLGMAIAGLPLPGFAQSDQFLGMWQLNLAKSKYSPGPAPRSETTNNQAEGQGIKITLTGTNGNGNPINVVATRVFDGIAHPVMNPNWDAAAWTRIDASTLIVSRTKAGKLVGTVTLAVSPDGRTMTITEIGVDANGRSTNDLAVYDKQ